MSTSRKSGKAEEKSSLLIREILRSQESNKSCLDCGQRGPTYVNATLGSFICSRCSGLLRGLTPPHRIKSISMSSFTPQEVSLCREKGNYFNKLVWGGPQQSNSNLEAEELKRYLIEKYEKKRYYTDPATIQRKFTPATSGNTSEDPQFNNFIGATISKKYSRPHASNKESNALPPISAPAPAPMTFNHDPFNQINGTSKPSAPPQPQPKASPKFESFANFETANFESPPADPINTKPLISTTTTNLPTSNRKPIMNSSDDRYAALKDLDEIFKSTVTVTEKPADNDVFGGNTTGGSIFSGNEFGGDGNTTGNNAGGSIFSSGNEFGGGNSCSNNAGWANFNSNTDVVNKPVNPFSGSTQLNTSPWPTTGTSPVQSNNPAWPPSNATPAYNADNNNDLFANAPKPNLINELQKDVFFHNNSNNRNEIKNTFGNNNPWDSPSTFNDNMKQKFNPTNPFRQ